MTDSSPDAKDFGKYYVIEIDGRKFCRLYDAIKFERATYVFDSEVKALVAMNALTVRIGRKLVEWLREQEIWIGDDKYIERSKGYEAQVSVSGLYIPSFDHLFDLEEFLEFVRAVRDKREVDDAVLIRIVNHIFHLYSLKIEVATRRMECKIEPRGSSSVQMALGE